VKEALLLTLVLVQGAMAADVFPEPYNSQQGSESPLSAVEAAAALEVPTGFQVDLLASEPTLRNPIAVSQDARGRLWVAENFTYAEGSVRFDRSLRDRVLVFDDVDGDGRLEEPVVFADNLQLLTSVAVGYGGVWLCCPPQVLFIPDADGDLVPDGPAEVVLDGFDIGPSSHHNLANGLAFGPDGWLYGRCGHSCPARIGPPGTADDQRLDMEGGMWRYHVERRQAEVLTTGTTNPWGHDWTAEAECFFVNTVNGHLWHMIPGAHFAQANGIDPNPLTYELIDQHADHYHFDTGAGWQASRDGAANSLGGGHAHSGCLIYQGTNWPGEYQGRLFTLNFHGRRFNQEMLERHGSGYVARHAPDFAISRDTWFRGIDLTTRPDGSVVVIDWSDTGECHEHDGVHRTSGRLYRIRYEDPSAGSSQVNLHACSDKELALFQRTLSGWHAHHARLVLAARAAVRPIDASAVQLLHEQLAESDQFTLGSNLSSSAVAVRALLSLHLCQALPRSDLIRLAVHDDEHCRTWAVRLLSEAWPLDAALGPVSLPDAIRDRVREDALELLPLFSQMARHDSSGLVRLALASTLQRLPLELRSTLAEALVSRSEDATDHNLPLLVWYGLIPVADADPQSLAAVVAACRWPSTRRLITRRLAERSDRDAAPLDLVLTRATHADDDALLRDVLTGCSEAFRGWRRPPQPTSWEELKVELSKRGNTADVRETRVLYDELSTLFGHGQPLEVLVAVALDRSQPLTAREAAVKSLRSTVNDVSDTKDAPSVPSAAADALRTVCEKLVGERYLALPAAQGLSAFDDDAAAARIVEAYRRTSPSQRDAILTILVSRARYGRHLLAAVEQGKIAASALSAYHIRQLHALGSAELTADAERLWGRVDEQSEEIQARIAAFTAELKEAENPTAASLSHGRAVYQKTCSSCHRLYGDGGDLGPDLTGSGRHDVGYLAENILNPSGVVNRDWRLSIVELEDGRVLSGVVAEERERTITLITPMERVVLDRDAVANVTPTDRSPMPDGLLNPLSAEEIRDLVAYLRHPVQVPLP
jgi:putative membrane-bound dehydrogenase-like protein